MRSLGTFVLAAVALCASPIANAADMVGKAPPVYTEPASKAWNGLYAFGTVGYGWTDLSSNITTKGASFDSKQFMPGGTLEYRHQFGRAVLGAGISAAWAGHSETFVPGLTGKLQYFGDATAQFGIAVNDGMLIYAVGGPAWANVQVNVGNLTSTANHFGFVAGGGVDFKLFGPNWVGGILYKHYEFGDGPVLGIFNERAKLDIIQARIGYRFN